MRGFLNGLVGGTLGTMVAPVDICDEQDAMPVDRRWVRRVVRRALGEEGAGDRAVSVAMVSTQRVRELNAQFLGRDEPTDVLAFPLEEPGDAYLGEVVVCPATALAEASARGIDPQAELALYLVHGVLHLLGYLDTRAGDRRTMETRQRAIVALLGYDLSGAPDA